MVDPEIWPNELAVTTAGVADLAVVLAPLTGRRQWTGVARVALLVGLFTTLA